MACGDYRKQLFAEHIRRICTLRRSKTKGAITTSGDAAATWSALHQSLLDQVWFDHILDHVALFRKRGSHGFNADRAAVIMFDDGAQVTAVHGVQTGAVNIKPGRPKWKEEFLDVSAQYGRSEVGVLFCGAAPIAAALKEQCEALSKKDGTIFRLHKENF